MRRFTGSFFFVGSFCACRAVTRICVQSRLSVEPFPVVPRHLPFQRGQLGAVFQHLPDQPPLRFNSLPLFENQHGQNAVGHNKQNYEQWKHGRRPRTRSRSDTLSAVNDGQGSPQVSPHTLRASPWNSAPMKPYEWEWVSICCEWI